MRSRVPGQGRLLLAAALLVVGGWLPWLYTGAGPVSGIRGPGLWTFYAGLLALAGGLLPARWSVAAMVQGVVCAVVAIGLTLWQVAHVLGLVGTQGWAPGPGLVMTFAGGVLCAVGARQIQTSRRVPATT